MAECVEISERRVAQSISLVLPAPRLVTHITPQAQTTKAAVAERIIRQDVTLFFGVAGGTLPNSSKRLLLVIFWSR